MTGSSKEKKKKTFRIPRSFFSLEWKNRIQIGEKVLDVMDGQAKEKRKGKQRENVTHIFTSMQSFRERFRQLGFYIRMEAK